MTSRDKMKFFSIWSFISLTANFASLFGSLFYIFRSYLDIGLANFVLGFGCLLYWWGLLRYLDTTYKYSFISKTFKRSLPIVIRAILSIIPFLLGYAFLGISLFWES